MKAYELLARIRSPWLLSVSNSITRGAGARASFSEQLEHFYSCLEQAVTTGNPAWLDPVLAEWTGAPTLTDLQQKRNNVSDLLTKFFIFTDEAATENLAEEDALDLL